MSNPQPEDGEAIPHWTLGDRMAKARRYAHLGVEGMALELELTRSTIRDYEHDVRRPKRGVLLAYSMRTGVPLWWIEGSPPPDDPAITSRLTSGYPPITWWEEAA